MDNKLRDRVRTYCEYMNIRVSQFEKKAGLSNGYFNQVSKKPSDVKLQAIAKAHPELNLDWLCTGHGEMIKGDVSHPKAEELTQSEVAIEEKAVGDDALIAELRAQIERLESKVDNLNQELGEKNALLKLLRQGSVETA